MLYIGLKNSTTGLYIEDDNLCSVNVHLGGAPKLWLVIDRTVRRMLTKTFADYLKKKLKGFVCPMSLEHKYYMIFPALLRQWQIPYKIIVQYPGDLFFIRSCTYHAVVNMGRNVADAVNIYSNLWNANYDSPICQCKDNKRKEIKRDRTILYKTTRLKRRLHECVVNDCNRLFHRESEWAKHERVEHGFAEQTCTCDKCTNLLKKPANNAAKNSVTLKSIIRMFSLSKGQNGKSVRNTSEKGQWNDTLLLLE